MGHRVTLFSLVPRRIELTTPAERRLEKRAMQTIVMKKAALRDEKSLCYACYWAHIQKGFRESEEVVYCCFSRFRAVPFTVADCGFQQQERAYARADGEHGADHSHQAGAQGWRVCAHKV